MIYVTGDTHAHIDIGKLNARKFPQQKEMTKDDYVIVCGDFGLVWDDSKNDRYWQDWLSSKNFTTLWIDGNHENFDLLKSIPLSEKFCGKVREITPSIYHLERGQVFTIDELSLFVMGGARSHDRVYRKEHISWWQDEMPSNKEMEAAISTLDKCGWCVDYVFTHCAPRSVQTMIADWYENDPLVSFLERIRSELQFKHWYFGHYHIDKELNKKFTALYHNIVPLG